MSELATAARSDSAQVIGTVGSAEPERLVRARVDAAALASGDRVTLLLVARTSAGPQLSLQADSSKLGTAAALPQAVAYRAARTGGPAAGTEQTPTGTLAEAAYPVIYGAARPAWPT